MTDSRQESEERRSGTYVGSDKIDAGGSRVEGDFGSRTDVPIDRTPDYHDPEVTPGVRADEPSKTAPLFPAGESDDFRSRWMEMQTRFVDEPRRSVEEADALVKEVTDRLTAVFTRNRDDLERQWSAGDDVSTEDLRRALQRYRSFFERLLSM